MTKHAEMPPLAITSLKHCGEYPGWPNPQGSLEPDWSGRFTKKETRFKKWYYIAVRIISKFYLYSTEWILQENGENTEKISSCAGVCQACSSRQRYEFIQETIKTFQGRTSPHIRIF
jgi:hypothetical protein